MKIALVHNRYALPGRGSGEEVMVEAIQELLEKNNHQVLPYIRSSLELQEMPFGHIKAFFSGIYSIRARKAFDHFLTDEKPNLVLVQNVFPLFSPSILLACRRAGVPVMMRCPNYRLICPNGLFMTQGQLCERCSGGKEYWCVLRNCEQNLLKSTGYALRGAFARQLALFKNNVDMFLVLTPFAKRKLIDNGFPSERIQVLSALADLSAFQAIPDEHPGSYVGFVGRISSEKGVDLLIEVAKRLPYISFKIAGRYEEHDPLVQRAPENIEFLGHLDKAALIRFYQQAMMIVVPSRWYEGLPVVIIEAMLSAKPVICSRLGGLPDIVDDQVTGLLFRHDDTSDLTDQVKWLWDHPSLSRRLGLAGRKKAEDEYSPEAFYARLMRAYDTCLGMRSQLKEEG